MRIRIFAVVMIALILPLNLHTQSTLEMSLQGPVLISKGQDMVIQDIGSGMVTVVSGISGGMANIWTPDGCYLALQEWTDEGWQYHLLSITDLTTELLPFLGHPNWSPDGEFVVFANNPFSDPTDNMGIIRLTDKDMAMDVVVFRGNEVIWMTQWLSNEEFVYEVTDGTLYSYNVNTRQSELFDLQPFTTYSQILDVPFLNSNISPNFNIVATYYNMSSYRNALDPRFNELDEDEIATLRALEPQTTGFDLHFLNTGSSQHIDVNEQFIGSSQWSNSGSQLAVTTWFGGDDTGIYVYDLDTDALRRIDDVELWTYLPPTWSPDDQWITIRNPDEYYVLNLTTNERIPLDVRMNESTAYWSPVMTYEEGQCSDD